MDSIVLLMSIVYWYAWEFVRSFGNNPMTVVFKFILNGREQAFHVTDVNGNPSGVVLVVKITEPWNRSLQRLHIEGKISLSVGPHTHHTRNVHVEDGITVLECWQC
jgi:hypothetical protein